MWSKQSCFSVTAIFALVAAGCAGGTVAEAPSGDDAGAGGSCEDCQEEGGSSSSSGGESGDAGRVCNPGDEHDCDCADGSTGTQVCDDDGDGYGACDCPEPSTGGTGGTANECVNGQQRSCTCNNGNDGIQVCNNGCWGACDCPDYQCTPGDEDPCPCGNGVTGTQVCASDGQSWGTCDCPEPSTGGTGGSGGSGGSGATGGSGGSGGSGTTGGTSGSGGSTSTVTKTFSFELPSGVTPADLSHVFIMGHALWYDSSDDSWKFVPGYSWMTFCDSEETQGQNVLNVSGMTYSCQIELPAEGEVFEFAWELQAGGNTVFPSNIASQWSCYLPTGEDYTLYGTSRVDGIAATETVSNNGSGCNIRIYY
jgi:hypothetical protein